MHDDKCGCNESSGVYNSRGQEFEKGIPDYIWRTDLKIPFLMVVLLLALGMASTGWAQQTPSAPSPAQQKPAPAAIKLEDLERDIGPLKIKNQSFTVVLHMKRVRGAGPIDPDLQETVARMEIRDEAGKIQYEKSFPYQVQGASFDQTLGISARLLEGNQDTGLLVSYGWLPSAPLEGGSDQVFGMFNGKLVPFSKPLSMEGGLIEPEPPEKVVKTSTEPNLQSDVLNFRVWTGNFSVIVPVRVDWMMGQVRPAWRCMKMTSQGRRPLCQFRVEAHRVSQEEVTFVRLWPEAEEGMGIAQHVVVKKDSKVEFLAAETEQVWQEEDEQISLGVSEDVWLKVRIDGKEGWIHTQEDLHAIGLPQAG